MSKKKSGYINLLFEHTPPSSPRKEQISQEKQSVQVQKFMEENLFTNRCKLKQIRIDKINGGVFNPDPTRQNKEPKRLFVDGAHLLPFFPKRLLASSNFRRNHDYGRSYSPVSQPRRLSQALAASLVHQNSYQPPKNENNQEKIGQLNVQNLDEQFEQKINFQTVQVIQLKEADKAGKDECNQFQNSTMSSSIKNIKQKSVRYRKIISIQKRDIQSKKQTLQLKKQLYKLYSNPSGSPQCITAKAFLILEHIKTHKTKITTQTKKVHAALNSKISLEVASLTKIMTCLLTIQLCERYKINISQRQVKISPFDTNVEGTSAELKQGWMYTVEQLLYGLMLPSGNDASIALAVFCGQLLQKHRDVKVKREGSDELFDKKYYYKKFIYQMNKKCYELDMKRTFFFNCHGLSNNLNKSCAADIAALTVYSLTKPLFRTIIATKQYQTTIHSSLNPQESTPQKASIKWSNTHRFVHSKSDLYKGIKTGTTQSAGPCLASLIAFKQRQFIIIVLNSKTLKSRYKDTEALRQWLFKKQQLILQPQ